MARAKVVELPIQPGATTDDTAVASKFHAYDMDKVRVRGGRYETIGGWSAYNASGMSAGTARAIHEFADLAGRQVVVAASQSAVNAWVDGTRSTITPNWAEVFLTSTAVTVSGTTGTVVWDVYDPATDTSVSADHNLSVGDTITFTDVVKSAGSTGTLNGTKTISSITNSNAFTFTTSSASITVAAEPWVTIGFRTGVTTATADTIAGRPRSYSIDNKGDAAIVCADDGSPIWIWQPVSNTASLVTSGTSFTSGWTGATYSSGTAGWTSVGPTFARFVANAVGSADLTQDISESGIIGGRTYTASYQVLAVTGSNITLQVLIDTTEIAPRVDYVGSSGTANAAVTHTWNFVAPSTPQSLIFRATASGTGTNIDIDNVSITETTTLVPLANAPQKNYAIFVDPNGAVNALGTVETDGDFNPTAHRWSDPSNIRSWVASSDSLAGEALLSNGSYAVCGESVGKGNLLFTDDGVFLSTWNGTGYTNRLLSTGCGPIATNAVAVYSGRAWWPSKKGFYTFDGAGVSPLQCPVKGRFVGKVTQYQGNKVFSWYNPEYNEWWIHYPHTDDGNEVSRYLIMAANEQNTPWGFGTFNRTCMVRAGIITAPVGIDTSGNIWSHETGTSFSGSGITLPYLETGYITGEDGDRWMGCRRYYPDIQDQSGNILFTVTGKRAPQGQNNTQQIGPLWLYPNQRKADFLISARQLKFKWSSETSTTKWRLGVVGLELLSGGARR